MKKLAKHMVKIKLDTYCEYNTIRILQITLLAGFVEPPICNYECVPNTCECRNDHVRDETGKCVPRSQCPVKTECEINQQWTSCGTICPQTCAQELGLESNDGICADVCIFNTCECAPGYIMSTNYTCVLPSECPEAVQCGVNEIWTNCGPETEKTCQDVSDPGFYEQVSECRKNTCICKDGFVRDVYGSCVPESSCPVTCGVHEVHTNCGTSCEPTCNTTLGLELPKVCTYECRVNTCVCEAGYVRDGSGACVLPQECPGVTICGVNEVWTNCGKAQPASCNTFATTNIVSEDSCILNTCECFPGYVRNDWGTCVLESDCKISCGQNEEWTNCGSVCPETCAIALGDQEPTPCTLQCILNTCKCKPGYVRDLDGSCVPLSCCSNAVTCSENEVWTNCATQQDDYCDKFTGQVALGASYQDCKKNTCQCAEGYVRNSSGTCVTPSQCESQFLCGANEVGILVLDISSSYFGNYTCQCKNGFMRNYQGVCVPQQTNLVSLTNCLTDPKACNFIERCQINEWLTHCGRNCYETCATMLGVELPDKCDGKCYAHACECQPGFVRLTKNSRVCVPKSVEECRKYISVNYVSPQIRA